MAHQVVVCALELLQHIKVFLQFGICSGLPSLAHLCDLLHALPNQQRLYGFDNLPEVFDRLVGQRSHLDEVLTPLGRTLSLGDSELSIFWIGLHLMIFYAIAFDILIEIY